MSDYNRISGVKVRESRLWEASFSLHLDGNRSRAKVSDKLPFSKQAKTHCCGMRLLLPLRNAVTSLSVSQPLELGGVRNVAVLFQISTNKATLEIL